MAAVRFSYLVLWRGGAAQVRTSLHSETRGLSPHMAFGPRGESPIPRTASRLSHKGLQTPSVIREQLAEDVGEWDSHFTVRSCCAGGALPRLASPLPLRRSSLCEERERLCSIRFDAREGLSSARSDASLIKWPLRVVQSAR